MPRLTQKVLNRLYFKPANLLDLPEIPCNLPHRLVYADIATLQTQAVASLIGRLRATMAMRTMVDTKRGSKGKVKTRTRSKDEELFEDETYVPYWADILYSDGSPEFRRENPHLAQKFVKARAACRADIRKVDLLRGMSVKEDIIHKLLGEEPLWKFDREYLLSLEGLDAEEAGVQEKVNEMPEDFLDAFEENPAKSFTMGDIDLVAITPDVIAPTDKDILARVARAWVGFRSQGMGPGNPSTNRGNAQDYEVLEEQLRAAGASGVLDAPAFAPGSQIQPPLSKPVWCDQYRRSHYEEWNEDDTYDTYDRDDDEAGETHLLYLSKKGRGHIGQQEANGENSSSYGAHYEFTVQEDVMLNFRVVGIWENPWLSEDQSQGTTRCIPRQCESFMITYLGIYGVTPTFLDWIAKNGEPGQAVVWKAIGVGHSKEPFVNLGSSHVDEGVVFSIDSAMSGDPNTKDSPFIVNCAAFNLGDEFADRFSDLEYFPTSEDLKTTQENPHFYRDNPGMASRITDATFAYAIPIVIIQQVTILVVGIIYKATQMTKTIYVATHPTDERGHYVTKDEIPTFSSKEVFRFLGDEHETGAEPSKFKPTDLNHLVSQSRSALGTWWKFLNLEGRTYWGGLEGRINASGPSPQQEKNTKPLAHPPITTSLVEPLAHSLIATPPQLEDQDSAVAAIDLPTNLAQRLMDPQGIITLDELCDISLKYPTFKPEEHGLLDRVQELVNQSITALDYEMDDDFDLHFRENPRLVHSPLHLDMIARELE
ncbi:hypothetical protein FSARC_10414 [Fusarium sarcochroum]|uniref:Uncharacterized protein n=1 Tax=Fusarium sarcochroum TaxID=1208366 RepID=A0A8H4TMW0_9HYPO|nr:hypothetical protein FSARC_10414 [Fusarium sarcochroum]